VEDLVVGEVVVPTLKFDEVSVHEEVLGSANSALVVAPTLDFDAVSVHEELLDGTERGTNVVTVSVSSTVVYKVIIVLVVVTSVCPSVGNPTNHLVKFIRKING
jgi:hypothetical protein